jgi:peptidoglycan hydrolase-like protein with peptidoglycan-binding domain
MSTPRWFTRELHGGEVGRDVQILQRKLGLASGVYDDLTQAHIRGLQRHVGLPENGVCDALTAATLGEAADHALPPEWFRRTLEPGFSGEDVAGLREALGLPNGDRFDRQTSQAVRRLRSAHGLPPSDTADISVVMLLP